MSKSRWIIAVTLGLTLLALIVFGLWYSWELLSAYQQNHADERASAAEHQTRAANQSIEICRSRLGENGFVAWFECVVEAVAAYGEDKHAEYDLKAQQDMAAWAFGMLVVTVWIAVITLVGVVFVGWTLIATRKMALDTRDIGVAQNTSYLVPDYIETTVLNAKPILVTVTFDIRNAGSTPSDDTVVCVRLAPYNKSFPEGSRAWTNWFSDNVKSIEAGATVRSGFFVSRETEPESMDWLQSEITSHVAAEIEIIWSDVFGTKHRKWFGMYDRIRDDALDKETLRFGVSRSEIRKG